MKTSLGLLEVAGLALAVKAADTMAKAASVAITGIEKTNGSGWMLITITGDVAAVNSAIANGATLARLENGWVAERVIARPADGLDGWPGVDKPVLPAAPDRTALSAASAPEATTSLKPTQASVSAVEPVGEAKSALAKESVDQPGDMPPTGISGEPATLPDLPGPVPGECNLCHDPACPRRKGEPRATCIHDGERG
ncbi:BMC domain-containing protein [Acerihabitans arboris]|uniref:BMC domain-containing protein n=1 Tax=Acerihabitans arboris TaxID=2691583 RepID=A0A845SH56_9GAMM|nr:BMC domain-containing protein [Acerihabitans arboris]NDL63199.1 BMC domain-containing protein [Acerihabitans arboris]